MDLWALLLLAGLGAYHGINPAMGWLFAVALGMQERDRKAVLRPLLPIAIRHELALVTVVILVLGLGLFADSSALHLGAGIALVLFGIFRFVKPRAHFRWTKVRVNRRELTWWSFLMSTAHGAGLMVAPVLIGAGAVDSAAAKDHGLEAARSGIDVMTAGLGGAGPRRGAGGARAPPARRRDDRRDGCDRPADLRPLRPRRPAQGLDQS